MSLPATTGQPAAFLMVATASFTSATSLGSSKMPQGTWKTATAALVKHLTDLYATPAKEQIQQQQKQLRYSQCSNSIPQRFGKPCVILELRGR